MQESKQDNLIPKELHIEITSVGNTIAYFWETVLEDVGIIYGAHAYAQCIDFFKTLLNGRIYEIESLIGVRPIPHIALIGHLTKLKEVLKNELALKYLTPNIVAKFSDTEYNPINYFLEFIAYNANILPRVGNGDLAQEAGILTSFYDTHQSSIRGSVCFGDERMFTDIAT